MLNYKATLKIKIDKLVAQHRITVSMFLTAYFQTLTAQTANQVPPQSKHQGIY